ncbi:MAG: precorrin-8X methylmutase [Chloroflexota bacterium]|nr:precorrin-8X methylmutase [Chloroflexota bacterium]MDE2687764.1 precorrin-8X methylmutase [Chloroflexota bacterium]
MATHNAWRRDDRRSELDLTLLQRFGLTPDEIDRRSLEMVEDAMPPTPHLTARERYVLGRIVRAEGEPQIVGSVRFSDGAVERGTAAIRAGATIITDVRMVEVGTSKALLRRTGNPITTMIDAPSVAERAKREGITRSAAAIRELTPQIDDAVVAVGNAPTALLALLDCVDEGKATPALIIGMPVGFVACAESKDELAKRSVPHITILGNRGGSSAAAATLNALLSLSMEDAI